MSINPYKPKWPRRAYLGPAGDAQAKREAARKQSAAGKPKSRHGAARRQRKAIKPRSAKMTKLMAQYRADRAVFLTRFPWCQNCHTSKATEVHHAKGRIGSLLLDRRFWWALCSTCHRFCHDNPSWAYAEGLMIKRT